MAMRLLWAIYASIFTSLTKLKNLSAYYQKKDFLFLSLALPKLTTCRGPHRDKVVYNFSKFVWTIMNLIHGIPFIHSGFELSETHPVNTGLCFEPWELSNYPPEKLPLFSECQLCWTSENEWTRYMRKISAIRKEIINPRDYSTDNIIALSSSNINIISFIRKGIDGKSYLFIGNMNPEKELYFYVKLPGSSHLFRDVFSGKFFQFYNDEIITNLKPFEMMFGELVFEI